MNAFLFKQTDPFCLAFLEIFVYHIKNRCTVCMRFTAGEISLFYFELQDFISNFVGWIGRVIFLSWLCYVAEFNEFGFLSFLRDSVRQENYISQKPKCLQLFVHLQNYFT